MLKLANFGISIVSSQAREIAYILMKDLNFCNKTTKNIKKFSLKIGDIQIDN